MEGIEDSSKHVEQLESLFQIKIETPNAAPIDSSPFANLKMRVSIKSNLLQSKLII